MIFIDIGVALLIAAILAAIFIALGRPGPWAGFAWFYLVVFLMALLGGTLAAPFGPPVWGVYWAPFLLFGIVAATLLAAASAPRRPRTRTQRKELIEEDMDRAPEQAAVISLNLFFWMLVALVIASVAFGYLV